MIAKIVVTLFLNLLIFTSSIYAQDSVALKIKKIDALITNTVKNEKKTNEFNHLYLDGSISSKKKVLGFFYHTISKGGFAETYLLKDTLLLSLTIGSREYLIKDNNQSTNKMERFIYDNESLCFYSETKYFEYKGKPDSLIYQIDCYFDNLKLIKININGTFKLDEKLFSNKIIQKSKDKIEDKNTMTK